MLRRLHRSVDRVENTKRWPVRRPRQSGNVTLDCVQSRIAASGRGNPSVGGQSAAVISTPRPFGRGGDSVCPGRKPKDCRGFPNGGFPTPRLSRGGK